MRASNTKRLLMSAIGLVVIVVTQGCSMFGDIIKEHEQICIKNKKVIVHDEKLWREYKLLAEISYQKSDDEYQDFLKSDKGPKRVSGGIKIPNHQVRMNLEYVEGFDERYGSSFNNIRPMMTNLPYSDGKIIRDDLFLMKKNKIVIQVVDYIIAWQTIDNLNGLDCLGHYGIIYKRDEL